MASPKIPSPPKPVEFARNYERLLRTAEQQQLHAREMSEAARQMCNRAAEMREQSRYCLPWAYPDLKK